MTVRDYAALAGAAELVAWDVAFDLARVVKSDARARVGARERRASTPRASTPSARRARRARPRARCSRRRRSYFVEQGCGRLTMNMVLVGADVRDAAVQDRRHAPSARLTACSVARGRRAGRPLGRGLARDLPGDAERRDEADARGVRGVLRGRADRAPRRARPRTTSHRAVVEGLPRARLPPRPRHGPLDRDDDDRVPEDRRGRSRRSSQANMVLLDAPARDLGGRPRRASTCRTRGS